MKTFLIATGLAIMTSAPVAALPQTAAERATLFAICIGKYTAMQEHSWMTGDSQDSAADRRALFEALLDGTMANSEPYALNGPQLLNYRLSAKHSQARLLYTASFDKDERLRNRAQAMARREMGVCESLIL